MDVFKSNFKNVEGQSEHSGLRLDTKSLVFNQFEKSVMTDLFAAFQ